MQLLIVGNTVLACLFAFNVYMSLTQQEGRQLYDTSAKAVAYKEDAQKIVRQCTQKETEPCYKQAFTKVTMDKGITYAEQTLYALQDVDAQVRHCHVLSHEIGKVAVKKNPDDWKKLLDKVNADTCGGGFLHGILEAHVGYDSEFAVNADFINEICFKNQKTNRERTCSHIMGHLLLIDTKAAIDPALPICGGVDSSMRLDCYTGIFMEDSFQLALIEHGFVSQLPVKDAAFVDKQEKRCLQYTDVASVACWTDMSELFTQLSNNDPATIYERCYNAPDKTAGNHCYLRGAILMAVTPVREYDTAEKLQAVCRPYDTKTDIYKKCIDFMTSAFMFYSPKFANRGITLCTHIEDSLKEFCFKSLGEKLAVNITSVKEREKFCQGTPSEYKRFCIS